MNRLQEKRNVSLISVCMGSIAIERADLLLHPALGSQEGYHGSVWESELCEDKSLIIFFAGREKLFAERGI